jgi:hypothetical protein
MQLKDLKEWVDNLPEEFGEYNLVNAEKSSEEQDGEFQYRLDKPIITIAVDDETKEILFFNEHVGTLNNEELQRVIDDMEARNQAASHRVQNELLLLINDNSWTDEQREKIKEYLKNR